MKIVIGVVMIVLLVCANALAADDPVLAKIGERKIMLSDLNRLISYFDAEKRKAIEQQPQAKATLLQRMVQGIVFSQKAKEQGLDTRPEIREQIEMAKTDFLASEYLKREVLDKISISDDELRSYYKSHEEEFRIPEMIRTRYILLKGGPSEPEEARKGAKGKAAEVLKRIKAGEDFAKLASEFNEDPNTKQNGGDLGFVTKGKLLPELDKVLFTMKTGEVSEVIDAPMGFFILKAEERKESIIEPFEKVKDRVRENAFNSMKKPRLDDFVNKAMEDAKVEFYLDALRPMQK